MPRIRKAGSAGVRDYCDVVAGLCLADQFRSPPFFVVIVQGDESFFNLVMVEQFSRVPRVFAGDEICAAESFERPKRNVPQVSDRSRE